MSNKQKPKTVEAIVTERREKIDLALQEIIDTIEKYFLTSPFDFIEGREGDVAWHVFPNPETQHTKLDAWADRWMCMLFPEADEAQRMLDEEKIYSDAPGELAFAAEHFGFVIGVLVGCKMMGATRQQLKERSEGFTLPELWRARNRAEHSPIARQRKEKRQ